MGNSTVSLQDIFDKIASKGIYDPRQAPSGYGDKLALRLANNVIADLIEERYNWKWNSFNAAPIYTNGWQQDYPQPQQSQGIIGWGEQGQLTDINNTSLPLPEWTIGWRRQLSRTSVPAWRPSYACWMYNKDLTLGTWPGAGVTFYPLVGVNAPQGANPIMSMVDKNGNILIVTGFGVTGTNAPFLAANAAEGQTVTDGSVTWTCVSPNSQGFRMNCLPSQTGPTYQLIPVLQLEPPVLTSLDDTIDPIPDSFSRYFDRGLEIECLDSSPNPADQKRAEPARGLWLKTLMDIKRQADKELNVYGLVPMTSPVERRWEQNMGPVTADQPYGS